MSEVAVQKEIPVVVNSPAHNRNVARAAKDQEELDQLRYCLYIQARLDHCQTTCN